MLMLDYAYSCTMIITSESWLLEPYPFSAFVQIADYEPVNWARPCDQPTRRLPYYAAFSVKAPHAGRQCPAESPGLDVVFRIVGEGSPPGSGASKRR